MKYLHLYNNQTDYDNEKNTLILPSASLIEKNNHVEYNPHQYVEIAGIKWATMNVGAKSITDYGLYFQWGDIQGYNADQVTGNTEPKKAFSWSDYSLTTNGGQSFTKYNETGMTLALEDDAVNAAWGGSWRMPKVSDFKTLSENVTTTFVTDYNKSGVAGLVCTAEDGKQLFFPACGEVFKGRMNGVGKDGDYWSKSLSDENELNEAYEFSFVNKDVHWQTTNFRYHGCAVRGVWDDKLTN